MSALLTFYIRLLTHPWNMLLTCDFITLIVLPNLLALTVLTHRWNIWKVYYERTTFWTCRSERKI